ncbi:3'(2'),5'-bisphosphate nucleotidase [Candidatus Binatia bacterium]|jgi:3'(2'), 5'-bisphosphate nucleotidase|nr:3'(2'),5'-bisphosphate nucleotidase [Candidatus Binatia bacterium]
MLESPESKFAIAAVREACAVIRAVQKNLVTAALTKSDKSPVTVADFAAQGAVARRFALERPSDVLVGEEDAADLRSAASRDTLANVTRFVGEIAPGASADDVCAWIDRGRAEPVQRFWTLDPVDGTKGFLRGEQYAVALALIEGGRVKLGVLGCPNLRADGTPDVGGTGCVVAAERGRGTWASPLGSESWSRLLVSGRRVAKEARLLRSVEAGHTNVDEMGELVVALGGTAEPVLMDSQAKYGVLAAGCGELLFRLLSPSKPDYRERIWDQAAGSIVVEEAGGRVTDLDGKTLDFSRGRTLAANRGIVASNGVLHDAALAALRQVGA